MTNVTPLTKTERVVVDVPILTFRRAWMSVSNSMRKNLDELDNVQLEFSKRNQKTMFITKVRRVKATPDQIEFADEVYGNPDFYAPFSQSSSDDSEGSD